jgi:rhamnose utilization protein RhaD (predicted bifunctional aldolase and dehydrogenase)
MVAGAPLRRPTHMLPRELTSLVRLSSQIGHDLNLVQAGGGNTSLKDDGDLLWIKASGKWMVNAAEEDIFVPVPMAQIKRNLETGDEKFPEYPTGSGALLRPSVETTMHAVLPHRVVIHVHSVSTIAWAAQNEGDSRIGKHLAGLRWSWIPYIHPGVPLALRIRESLELRPDVLILGNHGLVVGAGDCDTAARLLEDVERRLALVPREAPAADFSVLKGLAEGSGWSVAKDDEVHSLATDAGSCRIAAAGTMYPDHCVYLGPAAPDVRPGESIENAVSRYTARYEYEPGYLLVAGAGVLTSDRLSRAGHELLVCLKRVVERIPIHAAVHYLEDWQVAKLMNWDAEKYRLAMAQVER